MRKRCFVLLLSITCVAASGTNLKDIFGEGVLGIPWARLLQVSLGSIRRAIMFSPLHLVAAHTG